MGVIDILKDYCHHLLECPDTFINRIFGCHGIRLHEREEAKFFIVIESVMWTGNSIAMRFDLKGSTVDRTVYKKEEGKERLRQEYQKGEVKELMKDTDMRN